MTEWRPPIGISCELGSPVAWRSSIWRYPLHGRSLLFVAPLEFHSSIWILREQMRPPSYMLREQIGRRRETLVLVFFSGEATGDVEICNRAWSPRTVAFEIAIYDRRTIFTTEDGRQRLQVWRRRRLWFCRRLTEAVADQMRREPYTSPATSFLRLCKSCENERRFWVLDLSLIFRIFVCVCEFWIRVYHFMIFVVIWLPARPREFQSEFAILFFYFWVILICTG